MAKIFNVSGACNPEKHYMVDIRSRLEEIKQMTNAGEYCTMATNLMLRLRLAFAKWPGIYSH